MILMVANTKGAVGKTTRAVNFAIASARAGRDVLLIDGDDQATSLTFTEFRSESGVHDFTAMALHDRAIRSQTPLPLPKYAEKVLTREYQLALPDREKVAALIARPRRLLAK